MGYMASTCDCGAEISLEMCACPGCGAEEQANHSVETAASSRNLHQSTSSVCLSSQGRRMVFPTRTKSQSWANCVQDGMGWRLHWPAADPLRGATRGRCATALVADDARRDLEWFMAHKLGAKVKMVDCSPRCAVVYRYIHIPLSKTAA